MHRRREPTRRDPAIERRTRQRGDPDHVPDAVEGWNYLGPAAALFVDHGVGIISRSAGMPCTSNCAAAHGIYVRNDWKLHV